MNAAELLQPITPERPCGEDLSFSPEFDAIREMRREDDPTLDQGEWVTELKTADWPGVAARCEQLLRERSKDLRLVAWWADAAARLQGLGGLAHGLDLALQLSQQYWDELHPRIEEGDVEARVGNLGWLLLRVEGLAREAPVGAAVRGKRPSLAALEAARARSQALARGALEPAAVKSDPWQFDECLRQLAAAGREAFEATLADAQAARAALGRLQAFYDERLGADSPAFSAARQALQQAEEAVVRLGRDSGVSAAPAEAEDGAQADEAQAGAATGASVAVGPLKSRAQALQQLREVAAFFRRTEPHSPVAYLADKAARWGDLPLHAWLRAVVKDGASLAQLEELLGVEGPPATPGE